VGAFSTRAASRIGQLVASQLAGVTLALLMIQRSAARAARQPD
jgi:hypothetical protein